VPDPTRWPGRKIEPAPDPTASRVGSGSGRVGPGLCKMSGSFGFFGFRVKIFSPCPARQSYRVKNFDPSPPIKLFGSGRVGLFSGGSGRVRRVGQSMPRSSWNAEICGLRRAPTAHRKPPPTLRRGGFGGSGRSNGSPHSSPYPGGEMNLPPRMGGVSTPPISLITPFLCDINPV